MSAKKKERLRKNVLIDLFEMTHIDGVPRKNSQYSTTAAAEAARLLQRELGALGEADPA